MALSDDVFLIDNASNDETAWDDRPKAEPPQLTLPFKEHIMTSDDTVVLMIHDSKEEHPTLFVEQLPTHNFHIPKRDGRIRWVFDFHALHRAIHHQVYPMPLHSELVTTDALLSYPEHHLPFDIEATASAYHVDTVIKQNGRPVAYYSCTLTSAQQNYTSIEKVLLSLIQTLTYFHPLLFGARLHIQTAHLNITHKLLAFPTQRMLRWWLLLDEFDCIYYYTITNSACQRCC